MVGLRSERTQQSKSSGLNSNFLNTTRKEKEEKEREQNNFPTNRQLGTSSSSSFLISRDCSARFCFLPGLVLFDACKGVTPP